MSEYQEFTGKTVEEALRNAREAFAVGGLDDLDFEILTPGSRGVLGMGAEPARIIAAARAALGGAAPRREAAAATPLPPPPPRPPREERFGDRDRGRGRDRGGDRGGDRDRGRDRDRAPRDFGPVADVPTAEPDTREPEMEASEPGGLPAEAPYAGGAPESSAPARRMSPDRQRRGGPPSAPGGDRRPGSDRGRFEPRTGGARPEPRPTGTLSQRDQAELASARATPTVEREEIQAAEASPEALATGKEMLEQLLNLMGYQAQVHIRTGDTAKLDVTGDEGEDGLGALIGRKGERLSALQHLLNLMLSRRMGGWTRVLVDVEDYRGRRERQLLEIASRAAERVIQSGAMLQLEPMPALERRWIHLALRGHAQVTTQSIGEEPQRRVVILRRE